MIAGIGILAIVVVATAAGCSWFKLSKGDQKDLITKASENLSNAKAYEIKGTMNQKGTSYDIELTKSGDEFSMSMTSKGATLKIASISGYTYLGNSSEWLRYKSDTSDSTKDLAKSFDFKEVSKDFNASAIDSGKIVYVGKESVDGTGCHKFTYTDLGSDTQDGILWISASKKEIKKIAITSAKDETTGEIVFDYSDVSVDAPKDYTEVDIQKDYQKIFNIMSEFMKANPNFGKSS